MTKRLAILFAVAAFGAHSFGTEAGTVNLSFVAMRKDGVSLRGDAHLSPGTLVEVTSMDDSPGKILRLSRILDANLYLAVPLKGGLDTLPNDLARRALICRSPMWLVRPITYSVKGGPRLVKKFSKLLVGCPLIQQKPVGEPVDVRLEFDGEGPLCRYVSAFSKTGVLLRDEDGDLLAKASGALLADADALYWSKLSNAAIPLRDKCQLRPVGLSASKRQADGLVVMRAGEQLDLEIGSGQVGGYLYLIESTPGGHVRCRDFADDPDARFLLPHSFTRVRLPEMVADTPDELSIFSLLISQQPLALGNFVVADGPELEAASFVNDASAPMDPQKTGPGKQSGEKASLRLADLDPESWDIISLFVNIRQ